MILDTIGNGLRYSNGPGWIEAFEYLRAAGPDMPEAKIELLGPEVTVAIARITVLDRSEAVLEAHRRFADIHVVLAGEEAIEWHPATGLRVKTPYDRGADFESYELPAEPGTRILLRPGLFAAFFPQDAHCPKLKVGSASTGIKKAVFKIKTGLW